jgi:hypothetical protein
VRYVIENLKRQYITNKNNKKQNLAKSKLSASKNSLRLVVRIDFFLLE